MKTIKALPFRSVLRPIRKLRMAAFVFQAASIGLSLAQPLMIGLLLDSVNAAADGAPYARVTRWVVILIAVSLFDFAVYFLKDFFFAKAVASGVNLMRDHMLKRALGQPAAQSLQMEKGDALNRIVNDSESYARYLVAEIPESLVICLRVAAIYTILLRLNALLAASAAGIFALYLLLYLYINKRLRTHIHAERERYSGVMDRAQETLDGYQAIKVNGQEAFFGKRFSSALLSYLGARIRVQRYMSLGSGLLNFFYAIIPITVLAVGAHLVVSGQNTLGAIIAFYSYTHWIIEPVYSLADLNRQRQQALAALPRLKELGNEPLAGQRGQSVLPITRVALEKACFHYREDTPILRDLSLELKSGDRLAVTGPSGVGKTSLAHLLLGLARPVFGQIRVDGVPLDQLDEAQYLQRCAYLPQDIFLFAASLVQNITFEEQPDAWLNEVIRLSCLDPRGLGQDKPVESLSGGERQRVGIARAFYRRPDILICDEPTSALDEKVERQIIQALDKYLAENPCIFIVITHRKSLLALCGRELKLEGAGRYAVREL